MRAEARTDPTVALAFAVVLGLTAAACSGVAPAVVTVSAGSFVAGSDRSEREAAYQLDARAYGHDLTRQGRWYEDEPARQEVETPAFAITVTPITNAQYAVFVAARGEELP